ncbi:MAG: hypothetical protein ABW175_06445 [Bradyrhizobium sp.]
MRHPIDTAPKDSKAGILEHLAATDDTFRRPADMDKRGDEAREPDSTAPEDVSSRAEEDDPSPAIGTTSGPRQLSSRMKWLISACGAVVICAPVLGLQSAALPTTPRAATDPAEQRNASALALPSATTANGASSRRAPGDRADAAAPGSEPAMTPRGGVTPASPSPTAGTEAGKSTETSGDVSSIGREQQKASALPHDIAAARLELFGQALDEERARSAGLKAELAAAQRDRELQAEQLRQTSEEVRQLRQAAANTAQTLDKAPGQVTVQAAETAAAREESAANIRKSGQALDEERARNAAFSAELAAARRDNEALAAELRKGADAMSQLAQTTERTVAGLRQSLQQERERADTLARDLESRQRTVTMSMAPAAKQDVARPARVIEAVATTQPPTAEAPGDPETTRLIARARALLGQGNIGAARIVLERAAETGSARASFTLAETYDPAILSTWRTYGTRGDATRARELYAKAQAGGIQEARNRLERLQR